MGMLGKFKSMVDSGFKVLPDAPALTQRQERGLALGATFAASDYLPINALTASTASAAGTANTTDAGIDAAAAARVLEQSWDVHDAQSARATYRFLLDGGGHRGIYSCVRGYLNAGWDLSAAEERDRVERATREIPAIAIERGERPDVALNYFQSAWPSRAMMQSHYPRRIVESIAAWDAARVVHVSRFIVDAGFLYPDEAWAAIDAAVQMRCPSTRRGRSSSSGSSPGRCSGRATPASTHRRSAPTSGGTPAAGSRC